MNIKIGTRGSALALTQTEYVKKRLQEAFPMHTFEIEIIKTTGDLVLDKPISQIGNKGIFVREIEEKLLSGEIQLGVHSMKDMPVNPAIGLKYTKAWKREDPRDVLILREAASLQELKENALIGTGSYRRQSQLQTLRNDLNFVDIRGNVDTRIKKMHELALDGIVLAAAGLKRLSMEHVITQYLNFDEMVPSPAQGILALEIKSDQIELEEMLNMLSDQESEYEANAERGFLKEIDGDCTIPVGAVCEHQNGEHTLYTFYTQNESKEMQKVCLKADADMQAATLAKIAAKKMREKMSGMVSLVGAGPGDEKLITVKGLEAIQKADCILYDRLASPHLLSYAKKECELIYVGKANHNHTYHQEEINHMLIQKAMQYKQVVRLKGGDVFVFGRGSEEAIALKEAGVAFEIVPGVSSAIAGLAYAGIPITSRGISLGFTVVTAKNKSDELADIDFAAMQKPNHTYVFLMGLSSVKQIADKLILAGKPKNTPAAVISNATLPNQQTVCATLEDIANEVQKAKLPSPAIIVVGNVVEFRKELNFFEQKPLFGKKCIVPYIGIERIELADKLLKLGASVSEIKTGAIKKCFFTLDKNRLKKLSWILFTSKNGVNCFFEQFKLQELDYRDLAGVKFAVIGEKTKDSLKQFGFCADFTPSHANSGFLIEELKKILKDTDDVLLVKAKNEEHDIIKALEKVCQITEIYGYENEQIQIEIKTEELNQTDYVFFTCASSVKRICDLLDETIRKSWSKEKKIISIGPKCSQMLKEYGITEFVEAKENSYEGMINEIIVNKYN